MTHYVLNILTTLDRAPVTSIKRPVRELCLAHARPRFAGAQFIWEWADGEPMDARAKAPGIPRNLARAIVQPMSSAELVVIAKEAIATLDPNRPALTPKLQGMAVDLAADTDLGEFMAFEALRHAALREAAVRFTATADNAHT